MIRSWLRSIGGNPIGREPAARPGFSFVLFDLIDGVESPQVGSLDAGADQRKWFSGQLGPA
jgi:hypothetical protein